MLFYVSSKVLNWHKPHHTQIISIPQMSSVEKGGATIFPFLKVYVPAVKSSAAFWYNLRNSGDDDYYTRHASCPVILG
jgi:hypothetical protein